MSKSDRDDELTSPIPLSPSSNGEVPPARRTERHRIAEELYRRTVDHHSRRLGISRRQFIESSCGTLAALTVINAMNGCSRNGGANAPTDGGSPDLSPDQAAAQGDVGYQVPPDALEDRAQADALLSGDEFIFDVQTHNSVPKPPWNDSICTAKNPRICPIEYLREIFVATDTSVACLSGFPRPRAMDEPSIEARNNIKRLIDMVQGSPRLLIHANVRPALGTAEIDAAESEARTYPIAAWKTYPDGGRLNDPALAPFFQRARGVNIKIVASHRGLGGGPGYDDPYSPRDVVAAAKMYPDFTFLIYHSGFDSTAGERAPYNEANPIGIDRLIKAMKEFQIGPTGNVYAELGTTWNTIMKDPVQATHGLGKLLLHLGPDRILWGTDSLNDGNPKAQIEAFRMFTMNEAVRGAFGYPALTAEVKRKILGLNAARIYAVDPTVVRRKLRDDDLAQLKLARLDDPRSVPLSPSRHHGPRTWAEYVGFRRWNGEPI